MKPYYRILRLNHGRAPTVQHATLKEAETEALRLAGQHPGETFEILVCLGIARTTTPSIFWNDTVENPDGGTPAATPETRYPTTQLPEGFDRWECRGFGWGADGAIFTTGYAEPVPNWDRVYSRGDTGAYPRLEYWEAVKDEPAYRMLEAGERIEEGDEFRHLACGSSSRPRELAPWEPVLVMSVGASLFRNNVGHYRRPIKKP